MSKETRPGLPLLPSGVPHLDEVLGGGIPELSLTIVAGPVGAGKTTLAQQIAFHNATPERPALYFGTLAEPVTKLLRYQQQFSFFRPEQVGRSVHFLELATPARERGLEGVLAAILEQIERLSPCIVAIDSLRALEDLAGSDRAAKRAFVHELAQVLPAWGCTGFLLGEYREHEIGVGAEFSVADNLLLMTQEVQHNSVVRRLQVVKVRGLRHVPGRHGFRITEDGVVVFPRLPQLGTPYHRRHDEPRASFGISALDEMMRGGIPRGQTCMVAGSSGAGKTLLALHFAVAGARVGEPCVMATFEESPAEHADKMAAFGWDMAELEREGSLAMLYLRPVDLTIDEVLSSIFEEVERIGARRMVLNSISGMEIALPQIERAELREGLYRMAASLSARGVTMLLTTEVPDLVGEVRVSTERMSFLADNIILLRYVEIAGELRRALAVVKMRTSGHDNALREYRIGRQGILVEQSFRDYSGVLTGIPTLRALLQPHAFTTGLDERDEWLMNTLLALKQATPSELAAALGLSQDETLRQLERLTELGYVVRAEHGEQPVFRVSLITPGRAPRAHRASGRGSDERG